MKHLHIGLKTPGDDPHKRDPVAMRLIHIGLDLKYKGGKILSKGIDRSMVRISCGRRVGHLQEMGKERLHAKIGKGGTEKHRRKLSGRHLFHGKLGAGAVQKLHLLKKLVIGFLPDHGSGLRIIDGNLPHLALPGTLVGIRKKQDPAGVAVVYALKVFAGTDRPVDGTGLDPQLLFDIIDQIKGIHRIAVHLVDKGKDRDMAHHAYLKKFARLRLHALGSVNDHHRGIRRHQRTVRILREILVPRRIQNINAISVIMKLQYRRSDRDTSLLFDLHPIGDRMPGRRLSFYGSRQIDGTAIQKKLLRQCRFARIRVGNNGERAPFFDFFS